MRSASMGGKGGPFPLKISGFAARCRAAERIQGDSMLANVFRAAAAVLLAATPALALAQKKPSDYTVSDFFKRAQYSQMVLSPDGRKLAALAPLKGRDNLVIIDLEKRTPRVITNFE